MIDLYKAWKRAQRYADKKYAKLYPKTAYWNARRDVNYRALVLREYRRLIGTL